MYYFTVRGQRSRRVSQNSRQELYSFLGYSGGEGRYFFFPFPFFFFSFQELPEFHSSSQTSTLPCISYLPLRRLFGLWKKDNRSVRAKKGKVSWQSGAKEHHKTMYNKHHTRDLLGRKKHKEWLLLLGEKQQRRKQKADFRCPPNPHPESGAFQDGPGVEQLCGLILGQIQGLVRFCVLIMGFFFSFLQGRAWLPKQSGGGASWLEVSGGSDYKGSLCVWEGKPPCPLSWWEQPTDKTTPFLRLLA